MRCLWQVWSVYWLIRCGHGDALLSCQVEQLKEELTHSQSEKEELRQRANEHQREASAVRDTPLCLFALLSLLLNLPHLSVSCQVDWLTAAALSRIPVAWLCVQTAISNYNSKQQSFLHVLFSSYEKVRRSLLPVLCCAQRLLTVIVVWSSLNDTIEADNPAICKTNLLLLLLA